MLLQPLCVIIRANLGKPCQPPYVRRVWLLARKKFWGKALVDSLIHMPLVLPPVVGGVALLAAFSKTGLIGERLFDWFGIQFTFSTAGAILAETFVALPFFVITVEIGRAHV